MTHLFSCDFVRPSYATLTSGIYDEEGLKLTGQVLAVNPDIYTFWNYRKLALQHLLSVKKAPDETTNENSDSMLSKELELTEICLENNPKSYGAWHHRGWVLTQMKNADFKKEIKQCEQALVLDERNFHCWDHWRIVCKLANVSIEDQIKFSDKKVKENFSNYSAWHYRSTLLPNLFSDPDGVLPVSNEKFLSELEMVHNANFTDPDDQSTWFYRNWLFKRIDQVDSTSSVPLTDNMRKNLEFDLNQMLELSQLEKDKKWPLLIAVTCMKMLDFEVNILIF